MAGTNKILVNKFSQVFGRLVV